MRVSRSAVVQTIAAEVAVGKTLAEKVVGVDPGVVSTEEFSEGRGSMCGMTTTTPLSSTGPMVGQVCGFVHRPSAYAVTLARAEVRAYSCRRRPGRSDRLRPFGKTTVDGQVNAGLGVIGSCGRTTRTRPGPRPPGCRCTTRSRSQAGPAWVRSPARLESTSISGVHGWLRANPCSQEGIVSMGTNALLAYRQEHHQKGETRRGLGGVRPETDRGRQPRDRQHEQQQQGDGAQPLSDGGFRPEADQQCDPEDQRRGDHVAYHAGDHVTTEYGRAADVHGTEAVDDAALHVLADTDRRRGRAEPGAEQDDPGHGRT